MHADINRATVSPRITTLQQALKAENTTALEDFWQEISAQGTPLMEALADDEHDYLVTFLWRAQDQTHPERNVVIFAGPAGWDHPEENQMTRLLETDLWYKTYRVSATLRTIYLLSPDDPLTPLADGAADFGTRVLPDPLNPQLFVYHKDEEDPDDREVSASVLELPAAVPQPWIASRPEVAQGQLSLHRLHSHILENERRVWVYTPPDYTPTGPAYPLLLVFDGLAYTDFIPTPTILDNLISAGKLPPLVAIFPDSLGETRGKELPCNQPFVDFLTGELLPWTRAQYHVTTDPARTIVAGSSLGGLAAAFAGLRAPESFGNVLSQSGSFWWGRDAQHDLHPEWLIEQFIASPRLPLHFYLEVGLEERWGPYNMISCNRHFRDALLLKGYELTYSEFDGGHDYICWRGSLADGLLALVNRRQQD